MEGKYIALIIVGTIVPAAIICGAIGIYYMNMRNKENMRLNILFLSVMPVEFTIEISSNANWSGYYVSEYSYNFISGNGNDTYQTKGSQIYSYISLDSAGSLTVSLKALGITIDSQTTIVTSSYVYVSGSSPLKNLLLLFFLI